MSGFSAGEGYLDIAATLDTKQARNEAGQFQKELKTIGQQLSKDLTYIFQTGANAGVTRLRREMDAAGYAAGEGFVNKMRAGMSAAPGALGSAAALALTGSTLLGLGVVALALAAFAVIARAIAKPLEVPADA